MRDYSLLASIIGICLFVIPALPAAGYRVAQHQLERHLCKAVKGNQRLVVEMLCALGARAYARDEEGISLLEIADTHGSNEVLLFLQEKIAQELVVLRRNPGQQLCNALKANDDLKVRWLLAAGVACNEPDKSGLYPLHWAVRTNNSNMVQLLLDHQADIACKTTESGFTPLIYAAIAGNCPMIEFLIQAGADCNEADDRNRTPLCWAVLKKRPEAVSLLLEKGADAQCKLSLFSLAEKTLLAIVHDKIEESYLNTESRESYESIKKRLEQHVVVG